MSDKIREALAGMLAIVNESTGVAGYHLSGNIAEWGEFPEVEAARTAIAQQPAQAVPDGWRLVPAEPTPEMIQAGRDEPLAGEADEDAPEDYKAVYRAMLYAAPPAAEQPALHKCPHCGATTEPPIAWSAQVKCTTCGKAHAATAARAAAEQLAKPAPDELRARCGGGTCGLGGVCENCMMADVIELAAEQPDPVAVPRELLETLLEEQISALGHTNPTARKTQFLLAGGEK